MTRVERAKKLIRISIDSHAYYVAHPKECGKPTKRFPEGGPLGSVKFHRNCIKDYEYVIDILNDSKRGRD